MALHPNEAPRLAPSSTTRCARSRRWPRRRACAASARPGWTRSAPATEGRAAQEVSFRAHIAIAKRYGKALVIHDRDAHADVLRVLDSEGAPETVVLHCFSGDAAFAAECVRRGYLLSFAGTVTFANAADLRAAAAVTPPDADAGRDRRPVPDARCRTAARPNASYLIPLTVRALASATGREVDDLCAAISATSDRAFGPWG